MTTNQLQSIREPHTSALVVDHPFSTRLGMDYPFYTVLTKTYKDPDKIAKKLDELLGENGWSEMQVSFFKTESKN